jgi:aminopeptidase
LKDPRLEKLADLLVSYSTRVKQGDSVFIMCHEAAIPWAVEINRAVLAAGGNPQTLIKSDDIEEALMKNGTPGQLRKSNFLMEEGIKKADVFLTAWGNFNVKGFSNIDPARIRDRQESNRAWRKLFSSRTGTGDLRWCGTQYPAIADAQEAAMSLSEYEDFVYRAGLIDKPDPAAEWRRIHEEQERWVRYLEGKKELRFRTKNTDLTVRVDGRKWINCSGDENFPDGEVFSTPLLNGVNGHVRFTFPAIHRQRMVEDVQLELKDGKIIRAAAARGEEYINSVLDTDDGSRYIGEIAIGTNYGITEFTRNTLFDEKIGGTFHMAAGDAPKETGGENESLIHWDMICDMRGGGEIRADGEKFHEDGRFLECVLNR